MGKLILDIFGVIGGLSLFIYGMHIVSSELRSAAGSALRTILGRMSGGPIRGIIFGSLLGMLAYSGTATTMVASFVNGGLMSLQTSIAPIMGANIGTALAMQLLSFNISKFAWVAVGIGFLLRSLGKNESTKHAGSAVIGFGIILLGMLNISNSIIPYREDIAPWLAHIRGDTIAGRLLGVALSAIITALITSSGAIVGLSFALINAGVFTGFDQFFPVIAGAHIGTCVVAIVASLSMNVEARRVAMWHLIFNLFNVALALSLYPLYHKIIAFSSASPLHQAANLHLFMMLAGALPVLPATKITTDLLRKFVFPSTPLPESSHLQPEKLSRPEQAIYATILEIRRMSRICVQGMVINGELMLKWNPGRWRELQSNEDVINDIKLAAGDYLNRLTAYRLSDRQTLFIQHLDRSMKDIERIGDFLTSIAETTLARRRSAEALMPEVVFRKWFDLFCSAQKVLIMLEKCLNPDDSNFKQMGSQLLDARDRFSALSAEAKKHFAQAVREKQVSSIAAYYLHRYQADLDRMMGHVRTISVSLSQPEFWVRYSKFDTVEEAAGNMGPVAKLNVKEYLARLYSEEVVEWKTDGDTSQHKP